MQYVSTRGTAPVLSFEDALLTGLARDGGLYVPESWPVLDQVDIRKLRTLDYTTLADSIVARFVDRAPSTDPLTALVAETYAGFAHRAVAPLVQIDHDLWLMELFHGPTLAFKDYALQLVGRLFDSVLERRDERLTIVGATSGDTGSAAIEACRDRDRLDVFILFPEGRVSEVQRRQMTTVDSANVHAIAVEGTFDDCQAMVKAMFADQDFRDRHRLSAVNSINWARILGQVVYYWAAGLALGVHSRRVSFAVPTGNFGNVFAGDVARRMGLNVDQLIIGSNSNDIVTRFFGTGIMEVGAVEPTLSPSMDIQVSSNFERLLFEMHDRDAAHVTRLMATFRETGRFAVEPFRLERIADLFSAHSVDDDATLQTIGDVYRSTGRLVDPHTAVGIAAARACRREPGVPIVALACAHAAKFPDAVEEATGVRPGLPPHLADLMERPERASSLPNDLATVQAYVAERSRAA